MRKHQGEDISFNLLFRKGENPDINGFNDFSQIIVYLYTDGCLISKFSTNQAQGFYRLNIVSNDDISGVLPASATKLMAPGVITIEIRAVYRGSVMIDKATVGVLLNKNFIKTES